MLYLDSSLYLIIIILLCVLIYKVNNTKEGFNHEGKGFLAATKKTKPKKNNGNVGKREEEQVALAITATKTSYNIADLVARIVIHMPYEFLSKGLSMGMDFTANLNDIITPMKEFVKEMFNIVKSLVRQMFDMWLSYVKQGFGIMRNLPGFMRSQSKTLVNFIKKVITKSIELVMRIFNSLKSVFNMILEIPLMIFSILGKLVDIIINVITMIIKFPEFILNMIMGMQQIGLDIMSKTPTIPFLNMFFK
jgi:phage-related protein